MAPAQLEAHLTCPGLILPDINFAEMPSSDTKPPYKAPSSVLIIGSGVFGLSTALSLATNPDFASTTITVLDRSPEPGVFPARDAASIDSSRIIRADYADPAYASLATEAQAHWRHRTPNNQNPDADLGAGGRYTESGFLLAADAGPSTRPGDGSLTGIGYAKKSWVNTLALAQASGRPLRSIRVLPAPASVAKVSRTGGAFADWGYLNEGGGWADAEACMRWLYDRVAGTGRVAFVNGTAEVLLTDDARGRVTGARLADGATLEAELVVAAAGAWTAALVDLADQVVATGQVLGYLDITSEEQERLQDIPVLMNISTGLFIIPPRNRVLKIARHSYGYLNPKTVSTPPLGVPKDAQEGTAAPEAPVTVSQPWTHLDDASISIPPEDEKVLWEALGKMIPSLNLEGRSFARTRLCWYTDTPNGDWIIDYHPYWQGLFIATGGSGHAFKFLPVIGDRVVQCITGRCPSELQDKWRWKTTNSDGKAIVTQDGSRGGEPGHILHRSNN
ncbi:putative fructosyl amino acid protein [Whalleya microplaca]|nr:putative fructosyl amino acid protein [Whalleya microplaca]